jgi:urease accessory protein
VNDALGAVLQLADSAFPSGAFSHSFGLETALADGRVHDEATLEAWLRAYLRDAYATLDGAALMFVIRDGADPVVLDGIVSAATHAPEIRAANGRIARAILDTFAAAGIASAALDRYARALETDAASGVASIAFALGYATLGVPWEAAFTACASSTLAALAAVATRAQPRGQRATARVLWRLRGALAEAAQAATTIATPDDLCAQAFEAEIDALRHRLLDGRLFAS